MEKVFWARFHHLKIRHLWKRHRASLILESSCGYETYKQFVSVYERSEEDLPKCKNCLRAIAK